MAHRIYEMGKLSCRSKLFIFVTDFSRIEGDTHIALKNSARNGP